MEWMKWRKAALEWNQLWIKWIIDGRERAPLPPSLNERNGAQPKLPKQRGKLKWNPIKRISLFAFDGWNGRVGLALLGWVSGCRCSQWLRPIKRPAQPNNPSLILSHSLLFFLHEMKSKSINLSWRSWAKERIDLIDFFEWWIGWL